MRAVFFALMFGSGSIHTEELVFVGDPKLVSHAAATTFSVSPGEVNFTVPVRIEGTHPDVQAVTVECSVSRRKMADGRASHAAGQEVGRGATRISMENRRSINGEVQVAIRAEPKDAQYYSCWYWFEGKGKRGAWKAWTAQQYRKMTGGAPMQTASTSWSVNGELSR
jgi:hypothetical protein